MNNPSFSVLFGSIFFFFCSVRYDSAFVESVSGILRGQLHQPKLANFTVLVYIDASNGEQFPRTKHVTRTVCDSRLHSLIQAWVAIPAKVGEIN